MPQEYNGASPATENMADGGRNAPLLRDPENLRQHWGSGRLVSWRERCPRRAFPTSFLGFSTSGEENGRRPFQC
jgi:hypothetical protein